MDTGDQYFDDYYGRGWDKYYHDPEDDIIYNEFPEQDDEEVTDAEAVDTVEPIEEGSSTVDTSSVDVRDHDSEPTKEDVDKLIHEEVQEPVNEQNGDESVTDISKNTGTELDSINVSLPDATVDVLHQLETTANASIVSTVAMDDGIHEDEEQKNSGPEDPVNVTLPDATIDVQAQLVTTNNASLLSTSAMDEDIQEEDDQEKNSEAKDPVNVTLPDETIDVQRQLDFMNSMSMMSASVTRDIIEEDDEEKVDSDPKQEPVNQAASGDVLQTVLQAVEFMSSKSPVKNTALDTVEVDKDTMNVAPTPTLKRNSTFTKLTVETPNTSVPTVDAPAVNPVEVADKVEDFQDQITTSTDKSVAPKPVEEPIKDVEHSSKEPVPDIFKSISEAVGDPVDDVQDEPIEEDAEVPIIEDTEEPIKKVADEPVLDIFKSITEAINDPINVNLPDTTIDVQNQLGQSMNNVSMISVVVDAIEEEDEEVPVQDKTINRSASGDVLQEVLQTAQIIGKTPKKVTFADEKAASTPTLVRGATFVKDSADTPTVPTVAQPSTPNPCHEGKLVDIGTPVIGTVGGENFTYNCPEFVERLDSEIKKLSGSQSKTPKEERLLQVCQRLQDSFSCPQSPLKPVDVAVNPETNEPEAVPIIDFDSLVAAAISSQQSVGSQEQKVDVHLPSGQEQFEPMDYQEYEPCLEEDEESEISDEIFEGGKVLTMEEFLAQCTGTGSTSPIKSSDANPMSVSTIISLDSPVVTSSAAAMRRGAPLDTLTEEKVDTSENDPRLSPNKNNVLTLSPSKVLSEVQFPVPPKSIPTPKSISFARTPIVNAVTHQAIPRDKPADHFTESRNKTPSRSSKIPKMSSKIPALSSKIPTKTSSVSKTPLPALAPKVQLPLLAPKTPVPPSALPLRSPFVNYKSPTISSLNKRVRTPVSCSRLHGHNQKVSTALPVVPEVQTPNILTQAMASEDLMVTEEARNCESPSFMGTSIVSETPILIGTPVIETPKQFLTPTGTGNLFGTPIVTSTVKLVDFETPKQVPYQTPKLFGTPKMDTPTQGHIFGDQSLDYLEMKSKTPILASNRTPRRVQTPASINRLINLTMDAAGSGNDSSLGLLPEGMISTNSPSICNQLSFLGDAPLSNVPLNVAVDELIQGTNEDASLGTLNLLDFSVHPQRLNSTPPDNDLI